MIYAYKFCFAHVMLWGTFCGPGANISLWVQMVGSYELSVELRKWNEKNDSKS